MPSVLLFILGLALGSFLNVLSLRYDPDSPVINRGVIFTRSHCPHCGKKLRWFELIPVLSFVVQNGRCRSCRARLSLQYPVVEIVSGLILVAVPYYLQANRLWIFSSAPASVINTLAVLWVAAFLILLLISLIDFRLKLIPDELNIALGVLGLAAVWIAAPQFGQSTGSFLRGYGMLFGLKSGIWLNHIAAALIGALFLIFLILITRGRGMGLGDVKLTLALGLLFGWPDIVLLLALSFVLGSVAGLFEMYKRRKTLKSALPFGPFLTLAATLVFFAGYDIVRLYFQLFIFR
ncbi:MAG: prepilin peptidase [Patescibacteria group bacterium]